MDNQTDILLHPKAGLRIGSLNYYFGPGYGPKPNAVIRLPEDIPQSALKAGTKTFALAPYWLIHGPFILSSRVARPSFDHLIYKDATTLHWLVIPAISNVQLWQYFAQLNQKQQLTKLTYLVSCEIGPNSATPISSDSWDAEMGEQLYPSRPTPIRIKTAAEL